jgi:hypothetical protein
LSSQQRNPKSTGKMAAAEADAETYLPSLKRLVIGLEADCAKILPGQAGSFASTKMLAYFSLSARGLLPTSVGPGGGGIIKRLAERFSGSLAGGGKHDSKNPRQANTHPASPQIHDETDLAARCCAFLSSWQDLSSEQSLRLVEAFEHHLELSQRKRAKNKAASAPDQKADQSVGQAPDPKLLEGLAKSCLTTGWAHEYLSEKNSPTMLTRTQFFTPSWIAAYLCSEAIAGRKTFTLLDPACGAGHLLVQAVHEATSQLEGAAAKARLEELFDRGLFGLDLDPALIDLAAFALYLTARDRLGETNQATGALTDLPGPRLFCLPAPLGSLTLALGGKISDSAGRIIAIPETFDAVVMNPPYLSTRTMDDTSAAFLRQKFPDASGDLYTAFLQLAMGLLAQGGRLSTIVQQSFLSISRYRLLRLDMLNKSRLVSCVQLGTGAFPSRPGEKVNNAIITLLQPRPVKKTQPDTESKAAVGLAEHSIRYLRLHGKADHDLVREAGLANYPHQSMRHSEAVKLISSLSGQPFAFHCPAEIAGIFKSEPSLGELKDDFVLTNGLFTCDNERFVKLASALAPDELDDYVPYDKGGGKKWYHQTPYCLRWGKNGEEVRDFRVKRGQSRSLPGENFYFQPGLTYSYIGTKGFSARLLSHGAVFDIASSAVFSLRHDLHYVLGFFNSALVAYLLSILNPTINFQIGDLRRLPFKEPQPDLLNSLSALSVEAVRIAKIIEEAGGNLAMKEETAVLAKRESQIQNQIDALIFDHYSLSQTAREAVLGDPWVQRGRRPII